MSKEEPIERFRDLIVVDDGKTNSVKFYASDMESPPFLSKECIPKFTKFINEIYENWWNKDNCEEKT